MFAIAISSLEIIKPRWRSGTRTSREDRWSRNKGRKFKLVKSLTKWLTVVHFAGAFIVVRAQTSTIQENMLSRITRKSNTLSTSEWHKNDKRTTHERHTQTTPTDHTHTPSTHTNHAHERQTHRHTNTTQKHPQHHTHRETHTHRHTETQTDRRTTQTHRHIWIREKAQFCQNVTATGGSREEGVWVWWFGEGEGEGEGGGEGEGERGRGRGGFGEGEVDELIADELLPREGENKYSILA